MISLCQSCAFFLSSSILSSVDTTTGFTLIHKLNHTDSIHLYLYIIHICISLYQIYLSIYLTICIYLYIHILSIFERKKKRSRNESFDLSYIFQFEFAFYKFFCWQKEKKKKNSFMCATHIKMKIKANIKLLHVWKSVNIGLNLFFFVVLKIFDYWFYFNIKLPLILTYYGNNNYNLIFNSCVFFLFPKKTLNFPGKRTF